MMPHLQRSSTPSSMSERPSVAWSDADLLAAVARNADDPTVAHAAFTVFMERWQCLLYGHILFMCRFPPASQIGDTNIESETWFKVFRKAGSFDTKGTIGEAQSARTAGWLKTIATHALRDCLRRQGDRHLCALSDDALLAQPEIPATLTGNNPRRAIVAGCLQRLSERDADVLRTSAGFITPDGQVDGMPPEVRAKLLRRYETTEINLRQIRSRAYRKLKACVEPQLRNLD